VPSVTRNPQSVTRNSSRPWFVLAGGGTGGHLYPGLAVAQALQRLQPDFDVTVFGTTRPIDQQLTGPLHYELVQQSVRAFPRSPLQVFGFLREWRRSVKEARRRFEQRPPAMVLGLGGYAAGPPVVVAAKMGIPTAIFNPDAIPGRANRRLGKIVNKVFVQWEDTREAFSKTREVVCTGCPIRPGFSSASRELGCRSLKLDAERPSLLITGASQGAHSINMAAIELIELWRVADRWQIIHLTGEADEAMCKSAYRKAGVDARVIAYTEHMPRLMAASDLIISRAGASTLAEITAMGLPAVLMPYPFDKKKHQLANARVLVDAHAAELIEDSNDAKDNARRLLELLRDLMKSDLRRKRMTVAAKALSRLDAADSMASLLFEMARR
jgi:UDP-N-acetylglucosamine--N-acetylmuramyl-(pentapeptide) pyrophosphoryl-undecaprenol N-acetylglucosamine transferase